MALQEDGKGHIYAEVNNIRITYIPASDRAEATNWSGSDVIRVQAYKGATDKSLHMGAELPIPSSQVFGQFVAALCQVYTDGKSAEQIAGDPFAALQESLERSDRIFSVMGPTTSLTEFEQFAKDGGFTISRMRLMTLSAEPTMASECLQLAFSTQGAAIFGTLAGVITAYLGQKAARRITITLFASGKIKSIDARGYSEQELSKILPECREILVYEESPSKDAK